MDCHAKFAYALFARNARFDKIYKLKSMQKSLLDYPALYQNVAITAQQRRWAKCSIQGKSLFCWFSKALIKGVYGFSLFVLLLRAAF